MFQEDEIVEASTSIIREAQALSTLTSQLLHQIKPILESKMGTIQVQQERSTGFDCNADHFQCPLCMGNQGKSAYTCTPLLGVCCSIRNRQPQCRDTLIRLTDHPILQQLVKNPEGNAPYVKLFETPEASYGNLMENISTSLVVSGGSVSQRMI